MEVAESVFQNVKELEEAKQKVKPEVYLQTLYAKIAEKEGELRLITEKDETMRRSIEQSFQVDKAKYIRELQAIENDLVFKREERAELEKPLTERIKALDERQKLIEQEETSQKEERQRLFEKDAALESKLEGVRDLSDNLSEQHTKLQVREQLLQGKEERLKDSEMKHLVRISQWNEQEANLRNDWQAREYAVALREVSLEGKEENLIKREKQLSDGLLWLQDQRGVLERAWAELRRTK